MKMKNISLLLLLMAFLASCNLLQKERMLPILGNHDVNDTTGDTIYHQIPDFTFVNQDSNEVTNATFTGKIYVSDFFFTSCPTICPKVKKQMLRLHEKYKDDDRFVMISHTIDVKRDTVERLKHYAKNLGVTAEKWHFVTGEKSDIYEIAEDYMSIAVEDPRAPGGFDHSGWLILIDENRHIRSFCNGTEEEPVTRFMEDIDYLLNSK